MVLFVLAVMPLSSCKRAPQPAPPLPQRAYVWQRDWSRQVPDAIARSRTDLAGYVILACEIELQNGRPKPVLPQVDWPSLRNSQTSLSPAIRVMPYPGPFAEDDETARFLCETARQRLAAIRAAGIEPHELQLDFDCAQKKLEGYAKWVRAVRRAIAPLPLAITTLPCWLDEPAFPGLVSSASSYVLQVHSVVSPLGAEHTMVCDPDFARSWTARASAIGVPFEISLPTYRTVAGYDPDGHKLGAYSDAVQPPWPPRTMVREYATDLDAMAALVAAWQNQHPPHCTGLLWYRLPVEGDHHNCPWPALRAMTRGHAPERACVPRVNGMSPETTAPLSLADLTLINTGETDELPATTIHIIWDPTVPLVGSDLSPGWKLTQHEGEAIFTPARALPRVAPGAQLPLGWIRWEKPVRCQLRAEAGKFH